MDGSPDMLLSWADLALLAGLHVVLGALVLGAAGAIFSSDWVDLHAALLGQPLDSVALIAIHRRR